MRKKIAAFNRNRSNAGNSISSPEDLERGGATCFPKLTKDIIKRIKSRVFAVGIIIVFRGNRMASSVSATYFPKQILRTGIREFRPDGDTLRHRRAGRHVAGRSFALSTSGFSRAKYDVGESPTKRKAIKETGGKFGAT